MHISKIKLNNRKSLFVLTLILSVISFSAAAQPLLKKKNNYAQLIVNGKPFLMLGGEPGNSSASSLAYMQPLWPMLKAMRMNILSPDFYNPYFRHYIDLYVRRNNPLFIPEIRFEPSVEAKVFYAIGHYNAMGFSPFSVESSENPAIPGYRQHRWGTA